IKPLEGDGSLQAVAFFFREQAVPPATSPKSCPGIGFAPQSETQKPKSHGGFTTRRRTENAPQGSSSLLRNCNSSQLYTIPSIHMMRIPATRNITTYHQNG